MKSKVITGIMLTLLLGGMLTLAFNIHGGYVLADGSWSIATVDSTGYVGWDTSIALDGGDNPHISYYDAINTDLKYAYYDGASWNTETVDSAGTVGEYTSIALDGGDNPHISYYDAINNDLKYAYYDGGWNITTVDSTGDVGRHTSMALDGGDNPHISYCDWGNGDLKYAYYEVPPSVGGIWVPVDKLGLLAPYIALVATIILAISVSAAIIKYRKKQ